MIGHLKPTTPTIELSAGAVTILPLPLTQGQFTATTTFRTLLSPTMVPEPHFISSTEC